ncbi:MAG: single-stranded-DNA-specific exonuclease RecJ [Acidobacteria bacterium]|nr:single-stranded-DNA-specific exonuclease RecJ [Acidobacteriota bacterium]
MDPSRRARWILPRIDPREVESLAAAVEIHPLAARVLVRRGFGDPLAAARFLAPSLSHLHDPFLFRDMRAAVDRLRAAIANREKILVYGDYDADGTTSIVVLKKAIELAGGAAEFHVPHRIRDGYGMRREIIEQAAADGVRLIVSVDTGIRAVEAVRRASELGIDVIVTDHHLPETELPPALAVLNPSRPDCPYPEKNLCGAGVTLKLVQALVTTLGWPADKVQRMTASFLKLVAIGTVADVVPLTGENRVIVKKGLEGLRQVKNPGLRALLEVAGFNSGDAPSAGQVAFRIAPRMNAAGRMASASDVVELFLTEDPGRARLLAESLQSLNQERQQTESDIVALVLAECERQPVSDGQAALVFSGQGWHRGVVGIVASRLVEKFNRPVLVLSEEPAEGVAQGSGRSVGSFHLLAALESMAGLLVRYGGHRQAVGLSVELDRLEELRARLNEYAAARLTPDDRVPCFVLDGELGLDEVDDASVGEVLALAPFGNGNPAPLFVVRNLEVAGEPVVLRERHLRLKLRQNGRTLAVKAWNFAGRLAELAPGARVDAVVNFEEDLYSLNRGFAGWGAILRDIRPPIR